MNRTEEIANAYRVATVDGAWYGPTVAQLIGRTPAHLATKSPFPGAHSIAELLQHLLLWNERIRNTSGASPMPKWEPEKEWSEPPIPWDELVVRWNKSRDLLEKQIREFPVGDLAKQTPGRNYPNETMLNGIVQHAIYHSGQIAMILSMLGAK